MRVLLALVALVLVGCAAVGSPADPTPTRQAMLKRCMTWCPAGEPETVGNLMNECRVGCQLKWGKTAWR